MFHHFWDARHPRGQGAISRDDFSAMLDYLGADRILPAREWLARAENGKLREGDLCLTFDDNLRCQFDVAGPVLRERGMTGFWFVYTSVLEGKLERLELYRKFRTVFFKDVQDFYPAFFQSVGASEFAELVQNALTRFRPEEYLAGFDFYTDEDRRFRFVRDEALGPERYCAAMDAMMARQGVSPADLAQDLWMDAASLRQLHWEGHVIGLHSHTHPTRLENLDERGQEREYATNYLALATLVGERPVAMSHPCNSYNAETLRVLGRLGIRVGFRANMARLDGRNLEFPREDHANVMGRMR